MNQPITLNQILVDLEADIETAARQERMYAEQAAEQRGRRLHAEAARDRLIARLQAQPAVPAEAPDGQAEAPALLEQGEG